MSIKQDISVLYVEDEDQIRKKYVQYLKRFCSDIYEASDGEEAYEIYKEKRPNIILADINLPKLSGLNLVAKIRENDHNTKVIMLTAHSNVEYLMKATNLKLTSYLLKPVSRTDLKNALQSAIDELKNFQIFSKKLIYLKENCHWNPEAMELYMDNKLISLTKNEKLLTNLLTAQLNVTALYDDIIYDIWPDDFNDKFPALKTLVKGLRKKLPEESLENVRSIGYKIKL